MQNSMDVYLGVNLCEFQLLSLQNCLPVRVWVTYKYESHQCPSCSHATIKKGDRIYRLFTSIFFLMFYSWLSHLVPHLSSFFSYLYRFIPVYIIILQSSPMSGRKTKFAFCSSATGGGSEDRSAWCKKGWKWLPFGIVRNSNGMQWEIRQKLRF